MTGRQRRSGGGGEAGPDAVGPKEDGVAVGRRGERSPTAGERLTVSFAALMPSQMYGRRNLSPEMRLFAAVLEDAIGILERKVSGDFGNAQVQETLAWVRDCDRLWLFSFVNVCEVLDLDPDCLRQGIERFVRRVRGDDLGVPSPVTGLGYRRANA